MSTSPPRVAARPVHAAILAAAEAHASDDFAGEVSPERAPRAKTLTRSRLPDRMRSVDAASELTRAHVVAHGSVRSFAAALGCSKTRAHALTDAHCEATICLADLLYLAEHESHEAREIGRGILRDAAARVTPAPASSAQLSLFERK